MILKYGHHTPPEHLILRLNNILVKWLIRHELLGLKPVETREKKQFIDKAQILDRIY